MYVKRGMDAEEIAGWIAMAIVLLIGTAIVGAVGYGWVMNLVALSAAEYFNGKVALRAIGVFLVPIGVVMGYLS